jgi:hypothetical protein
MEKDKKNDKDKHYSDSIRYPQQTYKANENEEGKTSHRKRKLIPPARPGTISRSVIRKAVKEIIKERSEN